MASSEAISKGLAAHTADHPGYWIHTSGSAILVWEDQDKKIYGEAHSQSYNDWDGVSSLTSLPDRALHRDVDTIVLDCAKNNPKSVKTAIVCPPTIYGPGRGPDNQRSNQGPFSFFYFGNVYSLLLISLYSIQPGQSYLEKRKGLYGELWKECMASNSRAGSQ